MHNRLVKPGRVAGLVILILLLLTVYLVALYKLQIIEGEANYNRSSELTNTERVVTAARGNIYDRYGRTLVSNEETYNLKIDTDNSSQTTTRTRSSLSLYIWYRATATNIPTTCP